MTDQPEDIRQLLQGFISLGVNCEFGLLQRYCGTEPNDLLRFAFTPLNGLLRLLQTRFAAFSRTSTLEIRPDEKWYEFIATELESGVGFHTNMLVGKRSVHDVVRQECRRLPRLVRKLIEELEVGERAAVYCRDRMDAAEVTALHEALRLYGQPHLLVVVRAPTPAMVGSVVKLKEGLLIGYLDRVSPLYYARNPSLDVWLALLRAAVCMFRSPFLHDGTQVRPSDPDYEIPETVADVGLWRARAALRRRDLVPAVAEYAAYQKQFPDHPEVANELAGLLETPAGLDAAHRVFRDGYREARSIVAA